MKKIHSARKAALRRLRRLASRVLRRHWFPSTLLVLVMARHPSRSGLEREIRQPFHAPVAEAGELVCALTESLRSSFELCEIDPSIEASSVGFDLIARRLTVQTVLTNL